MKKLLPYLERVFLAILMIAFILQLTGTKNSILMTFSLAGLGVTYFLNAFRSLDIKSEEGEQMGFNELLGLSIVPKVLWMATAFATIGILFYTLQLNDGYLRMLYGGGLTIIIAILILLGLKATGTKYLNATFPIFFRALPTLLVVAYILFG